VHGAVVLNTPSAEASGGFYEQPHLNKPGIPTRLCEKKYLASEASREDFFSANPQGPGLDGMSRLLRTLLRKASQENERKA